MNTPTHSRKNGILPVAAAALYYALASAADLAGQSYRIGFYWLIAAVLAAVTVLSLVRRARSGAGFFGVLFNKKNAILLIPSVLFAFSWYRQLLSRTGTPKRALLCCALLIPVCFLVLETLKNLFRSFSDGCLNREQPSAAPAKTALIVAGVTLLLLFLYWLRYRPYLTTPDTDNQLQQISGAIPYANVHAIGHTLLLKLLLSVFPDFTGVVLLNVLLFSALNGCFSYFFSKKGVPLSVQLAVLLFSFAQSKSWLTVVCPLKDAPYAICIGALTLLLFLYADDASRFSARHGIAAGLAAAGTLLFRLNGIVAVIGVLLYFLIAESKKRRLRFLLTALTALTVAVGSVHLYAYRALGTQKPENGFSVQVFGVGLAAVLCEDELTAEEAETLSALLPAEWTEENYIPTYLTGLLWQQGDDPRITEDPEATVFNNRFVLALGEHKAEIVKTYIRTFFRHIGTCVKTVLRSTEIIWGHYRTETVMSDFITQSALLFTAAAALWSASALKKRVWVFLPVLLNALSIAISTVTNEPRYLFPGVLLFFALYLWILSGEKTEAEQKPSDTEAPKC